MSAMNEGAKRPRAGGWLLALAEALPVSGGARDIPKPQPTPRDAAIDPPPPATSDGPTTLSDAPVVGELPHLDAAPGDGPTSAPEDGPLASDAPDGPLPCDPACAATEVCANG